MISSLFCQKRSVQGHKSLTVHWKILILKKSILYKIKNTILSTDSLKLASLHEYYQRILHGSQIVPSGVEIANTLKYFIQSLLGKYKLSSYEIYKWPRPVSNLKKEKEHVFTDQIVIYFSI